MTALEVPPVSDEPRKDWQQHALPIVLSLVIFSIFSIWGAVTSEGFLEADAITHYLYARFAIDETHYLVNVWGRPLCTGLYALPAYFFGRIGVRLTSLLLAIGVSWTAYQIAKGQKHRWPAIAMMFTLAQPMLFLHSFSELTELPFAFVIGLAFLMYQRRQFFWMALLVGISPLGRPEGFGFIGLAGLALILHRQLMLIPLLFAGLLGWTYAGWGVFGGPRYDSSLPLPLHGLLWLKHEWPYAGESLYERGNVLKYVALLPAVVSPFLFPAMMVGVWRAFLLPLPPGEGRGEGTSGSGWYSRAKATLTLALSQGERGQERRCEMLIAVIPLLILAGHSILHALGKMASSGELRYLLAVAPFWSLLAARGWEWLAIRLDLQSPLRYAAILCVLPCLIQVKIDFKGYTFGYQTLPLKLNNDMLAAKRFAVWYKAWPERGKYPRVMASHPGVYYFLDISPTDREHACGWSKENVVKNPPGTVLQWDSIYGVFNADANRSVTEDSLYANMWLSMGGDTYDVYDGNNLNGTVSMRFLSAKSVDGESSYQSIDWDFGGGYVPPPPPPK